MTAFKRLLNLGILMYATIPAFCQLNNVIVLPAIHLPKDSVVASQFMSSLNKFLQLKDGPGTGNGFIRKNEEAETLLLLDEMKGMEKNVQLKNDHFYKPYLTNIVQLNDGVYTVAVAYMAVNDNTPLFRAGFNLMAHYADNQFYFSSPLRQNAATWRVQKTGDYTFYFKDKLNKAQAASYIKTVAFYDKKLKAGGQQTDIYCCDDFPEVLKIAGVDYNATYNGYNANTNLSAQTPGKKIIINASEGGGFNHFDPHDLWHDRLHRVVSTDSINKPVDEGCAFLYGGSWGISWAGIVKKFKDKMAGQPNADWLALFEAEYNFGDNELTRLRINYFINALLVQKIESEGGFDAVLPLLTCGKYKKDNSNYFKALDKLTGINKINFNTRVGELIASAVK